MKLEASSSQIGQLRVVWGVAEYLDKDGTYLVPK
jgi:hypothetical protein